MDTSHTQVKTDHLGRVATLNPYPRAFNRSLLVRIIRQTVREHVCALALPLFPPSARQSNFLPAPICIFPLYDKASRGKVGNPAFRNLLFRLQNIPYNQSIWLTPFAGWSISHRPGDAVILSGLASLCRIS